VIPRVRFDRETVWRLVPTRFPGIHVFGRLTADGAETAILEEAETESNARIQLFGPEDALVKAPFAYPHPDGSRFSDGSFGVWFGAVEQETAFAEMAWHRTRSLVYTAAPAMVLQYRMIRAEVTGDLADIRGMAEVMPEVYDPVDYLASRRFAVQVRQEGGEGVAFDSVRRRAGTCLGLFVPTAIRNCQHAFHTTMHWDGQVLHT
jgi:hypothetical protein